MQRLNLHTAEKGTPAYYVNLDPATKQVPFAAGIDIRDTVNPDRRRRHHHRRRRR